MPFIARFTVPDLKPPVRAYVHETGFNGMDVVNAGRICLADFLHIYAIWDDNLDLDVNARFVIGAYWRDGKFLIAELFGYSDIKKWPGTNPEVHSWVFRNGVYFPKERNIGDEETLRVLEIERAARKRTKNVQEYMALRPNIGKLGRTERGTMHDLALV